MENLISAVFEAQYMNTLLEYKKYWYFQYFFYSLKNGSHAKAKL